MKLARFGSNSVRGFGGGLRKPAAIVGKYFYSINLNTNEWGNISNWWFDVSRTIPADQLPISATDVIISTGSVPPLVQLSATNWVEPNSINAGSVGIIFYSDILRSVTCNITVVSPASAIFAGSAVYNF